MFTMEQIRDRIVAWRSASAGPQDVGIDPAFTEMRDLADEVRESVVRLQADAIAAATAAKVLVEAELDRAAQALHGHLTWVGNMPGSVFAPDEIRRLSSRVMGSDHAFACRMAVRRLLSDPDAMEDRVSQLDQDGGPKVLEALLEARRHDEVAKASAEAFRIESNRNFFVAEILAKASSPDSRLDAASLREHMRSISSSPSVADMARVMNDVRNDVEAQEHSAPRPAFV